MRNAVISAAFLSAVAVSSLSPSVSAQERITKPTLSVSLRSVKPSYSIKQNISLEILLENVGTESLLLCRKWGWGVGRTNVRVIASNGKEVFTNFLADELPPPPRDANFIELGEGEFFGTRLNENAKHLVNTPGTYDFFVEYTSFVSEEWVHQYLNLPPLPLWSRERGTIVSNKIRIEITP
jgi:hypothetical protein